MSLLRAVVCDSCGETKYAAHGEHAHVLRARLYRIDRWRQRGARDYCAMCVLDRAKEDHAEAEAAAWAGRTATKAKKGRGGK